MSSNYFITRKDFVTRNDDFVFIIQRNHNALNVIHTIYFEN